MPLGGCCWWPADGEWWSFSTGQADEGCGPTGVDWRCGGAGPEAGDEPHQEGHRGGALEEMKAVKVRALAPKERRLPWDEEWSGQEMLDPIADGEVWRSGRLSLEERFDVEDEEQSPTVWEGDQSFLATCDEVRDSGATSESGSMASSPCRSSMVASWTLSESDEDQGVTPMQTSSVRLRRNSMRSWPTTPTTSGGMGPLHAGSMGVATLCFPAFCSPGSWAWMCADVS